MRSVAEGKHDADLRSNKPARKAAEKRKLQARNGAEAFCDPALDTTGKSVYQPGRRRDVPGIAQKAKGAAGSAGGRGGRGSSEYEHVISGLPILPVLRGHRQGHQWITRSRTQGAGLYWLHCIGRFGLSAQWCRRIKS